MKKIHFCTPIKLAEVKNTVYFNTIRTGFIPQIFPNDVVEIVERRSGYPDQFIKTARVRFVTPILFKNISFIHKEEIERYGKNFNPEQYFFIIELETIA